MKSTKSIFLSCVFVVGIGQICSSQYDLIPHNINYISASTLNSISANSKDTTHLNFFGDFRFRAEEDLFFDYNRFRGRMRIRGGVVARINPAWKLRARMISTSDHDNPNSSHVNLTKGFNQIGLAFDQAYIQYSPQQYPNLNFLLGKFSNPNVVPKINTEIVWDADIQPEGLSVLYSGEVSEIQTKYKFINSFYLMSQFVSRQKNNWLYISQFSATTQILENIQLDISTGLYYYNDIKGLNVMNEIVDPNEGNEIYEIIQITNNDTAYTSHYKSNFNINYSVVELTTIVISKPMTLKLEAISNFGADFPAGGLVLGLSYGELKKKRDWSCYYQYAHIEREAIFTPFTQDDSLLRTNYSGHIFGMAYGIHKNMSIHLWSLIHQQLEAKDYISRVRLDLNMKF